MKDIHKCDACSAYQDPDGLACAGCEREAAAARREHARKLWEIDQMTGGQDERDYVTG